MCFVQASGGGTQSDSTQAVIPRQEPQVEARLTELAGRTGSDPARWLEYAEALHAHGLTEDAVAGYREVIRLAPAQGSLAFQARYLLAHAIRTSAPRQAAEELALAVNERPGYPAALVLLGEIREELGEFESAAEAYRAALAAESGSALALFRLGSLELRSGRAREAVDLLERALQREPEAGAIRATLAQAWNAAGDRERAREVLRDAGTGNTAENTSLPGIGDPIHFRMTDRDISSPRILERAREAREAGRLEEAENWFRDLAQIRPRDPLVLAEFGAVLHSRSKPEEAEPFYRDAIALDPEQPLARFGLGVIRAAAGDLPAAEFHFRAALEKRMGDPATHVALADVLLRQRRIEEGLAALDRASDLDPDDGTIHVRRAAALAELERFDEAWEAVTEARAAGEEPPAAFLEALRERRPEPDS